ncbi:hypothetical protein [Paenibacillus sp. DMB20]|uniref:hypothetical protein n=1 Tax=Paenibacillus sp. DMB20 TaxID=1642570 RepID=UPI00069B3D80|nr:hypothetical protein [Paenibacillus sp. DMB20]
MTAGRFQFISRQMWLFVSLVMIVQGCQTERMTAEEHFNRALAGLAGVDDLAFKGETAVRNDDSGIYKQAVVFQGQLQNHRLLTLTTSHPTGKIPKTAAYSAGGMNMDGLKGKMKYENGKWMALTAGFSNTDWMARLNPLEQLEYIGKSDKTVTEEYGAARGTRVLRIQLTPEASRRMTAEVLKAQMEKLRSRIFEKGDILYTPNGKARKRLLAVWERENREMNRMLEQSQAAAVYHLTVDKTSRLPRKLTSERVLEFADPSGRQRMETLVTEIHFSGYK